MGSDDKEVEVKKRFSDINLNLKRSFSKVKGDILKLARTNEGHVNELSRKLAEIEENYVARQDLNNEIDSFNKKYEGLRRELKKREKLKKELKEALKLREAVNSVVEDIKKINGIKREFRKFKDSVINREEFNMQSNKFDARIKKRAQDTNNLKKELEDLENKFIKEFYFNQQIDELRKDIRAIRNNFIEKNYFRKNINRLEARFKRIIVFLKKHPKVGDDDKKKLVEIAKSQEKEGTIVKRVWKGIVDFFTEEVEEPKERKKPEKKRKFEKRKKRGTIKKIWDGVVDFLTEEEIKEEWFEKNKEKKEKPKKTSKKVNKKNKITKLAAITLGVIVLFLVYYLGFFERIIAFIVSYKYNILLGIIILAIIIFLSERKKEK